MNRRHMGMVLSVTLVVLALGRFLAPERARLVHEPRSSAGDASAPVAPAPPLAAPSATPARALPKASGKPFDQAESDRYRAEVVQRVEKARAENATRYARALESWPKERRDEPWASEREKRLRTALQEDRIDYLLVDLQCREQRCRLELTARDSDTAFAMQRAGSFQREVGEALSIGMSDANHDRTMVLFVERAEAATRR